MSALDQVLWLASQTWVGPAMALVWGALWGSFLNVVIHRLPRGESLVRPGSHCPSCGNPVRWYDNVPILSWLVLRGRCRDCGEPISPRYPLVEALTATLSVLVYLKFVPVTSPEPVSTRVAVYLVYFAFTAALVAVVFIDLDWQIVPDAVSLGGLGAGLVFAALLPHVTFLDSALGAVVGIAAVAGLSYGYYLIRGIHGMGMGDAKLLGMVGAFLGYQSLLFVMFAASVLGLLAAGLLEIVRRLTGRNRHLYDPTSLQDDGQAPEASDEPPVPGEPAPEDMPVLRSAIAFGPYIAASAIVYMLAGDAITRWYLDLVAGLVSAAIGG